LGKIILDRDKLLEQLRIFDKDFIMSIDEQILVDNKGKTVAVKIPIS
jgi:hypothetical protein